MTLPKLSPGVIEPGNPAAVGNNGEGSDGTVGGGGGIVSASVASGTPVAVGMGAAMGDDDVGSCDMVSRPEIMEIHNFIHNTP